MTRDPIFDAWVRVRDERSSCPGKADVTLAALNGPEALPPGKAEHLLHSRCGRCEAILSRTWKRRPPRSDLIAAAEDWPTGGAMKVALEADLGNEEAAEALIGAESEEPYIPVQEWARRELDRLVEGISGWARRTLSQDTATPQFGSGLGLSAGPAREPDRPGVFGPVVLKPVEGEPGKVLVTLSRDNFLGDHPQGEIAVLIFLGGRPRKGVQTVLFGPSSDNQEQLIEMDSSLIVNQDLGVHLAVEPV